MGSGLQIQDLNKSYPLVIWNLEILPLLELEKKGSILYHLP